MRFDAADLNYLLGMAGTVAFAVTAVAAVTKKEIDIFGACVMGLITAIGGGTIRDLILGVPVFWASDLNYIWVSLCSSVVAFAGLRFITRKGIYSTMLYLDALGVALFSIQAAHKVERLDFAMPLGPILLGVITAIGGGLLRDVLAGSPTLLMRPELYAVPVTLGCTLYVILLVSLPDFAVPAATVCVVLIFAVRSAAIRWKLSMPDWLTVRPKA